jgi:hypothetical protein
MRPPPALSRAHLTEAPLPPQWQRALKLAPAHVFTVEMKKVKGDENGTRGALAGECGMEREDAIR